MPRGGVLDTSSLEYVYSRVRFNKSIADRVLGDGLRDVGNGAKELILYAYCGSREEALEFAKDVMAMGAEITALANDLKEFVKTHEFEKWDD